MTEKDGEISLSDMKLGFFCLIFSRFRLEKLGFDQN
jgi:hypothetical protein